MNHFYHHSHHCENWQRNAVAVAVASCFVVATPLYANPVGPDIANGVVSISQQGNALNITNSPGAIINWQGFSIGVNEITRFFQQSAASSVLNRVMGQDPSSILGALQSNGRVFLLNPNGVLFGAGAQVDVAGLVVSTLNLSNADFLAGRYNFTAHTGAGGIENQGNLTALPGGQIYLVAPNLSNSGMITSPQGDIILAAGNSVELVNANSPNLRVVIDAPGNEVLNLGSIVANSGRIGIYAGLINHHGIVSADTATVDASGKVVFMASKDINLEPGSVVSASGTPGGVHDGGEVRLIADGKLAMRHGAQVHVDGGADGGNGGFLELSGKTGLALHGVYSGRAFKPGYHAGSLLLDPLDINIISGGTHGMSGSNISAGASSSATFNIDPVSLNGGWADVTLAALNNINVQSAISNANINNGTAGGSLTLTAGNDITVSAQIGANSTAGRFNHDLTLTAGNNVNVNNSIYLGNNLLTLSGDADLSGVGNVVVSPVALSGLPAIVDTLGTLNVSGVGLQVLSGITLGEVAQLKSGNGQTINTGFVEVIASGDNDARITNTGGDQVITTSGMNASNEGVLIRNNGTYNVAGAWIENTSAGLQSITISNADKLVVDGATASAYLSAAGDQTILLQGAGANAIEVGTVAGAGSSRIEGHNQNIIAGSGAEFGSVTLAAGVTGGKVAYIQNLGGVQDIATTGALQVVGGSGASAQILNNGSGMQTVNAGDIFLQGGSGTGSVAWINSNGGGGQSVTATGNLTLQGGDGIDATARLTSVLPADNSAQTITVAGTTNLFGGLGAGAYAGIGRQNSDVNIVLNSTGDVTLTEGAGSGAFAGIGSFDAGTGKGGPITINGGGNITLGANTKIVSDAAGTVEVNAGATGDITLNGGVINTVGNVILNAGNNISLNSGVVFYAPTQAAGTLTMNAGNDINVSTLIGNSTSDRFTHDLTLTAGNNVNVNNSIYMGSNTLTLAADADIPAQSIVADGIGSVFIRPAVSLPVVVDTQGDLIVTGAGLQILGYNSSPSSNAAPVTVNVGGKLNVDFTGHMPNFGASGSGEMRLEAGNAIPNVNWGNSDASVSLNVAGGDASNNNFITVGSLTIQGGSASACGGDCWSLGNADAILSATKNLVIATTTGGVAVQGGTAGAIQSWSGAADAHANAELSAANLKIDTAGGILVQGGNANALVTNSYSYTATAEAKATLSATGSLEIGNGVNGSAASVQIAAGNALAYANGSGSTAPASPDANANANATMSAGSLTLRANSISVRGGGAHAQAGGSYSYYHAPSGSTYTYSGAAYNRSAEAQAKALVSVGTVTELTLGDGGLSIGGSTGSCSPICTATINGSGGVNSALADRSALFEVTGSGAVLLTSAGGITIQGSSAQAAAYGNGSNNATDRADAKFHAGGALDIVTASGVTVQGGTASAAVGGSSAQTSANADAELSAVGALTISDGSVMVQGGNAQANASNSSAATTVMANALISGGSINIINGGLVEVRGGSASAGSGSPVRGTATANANAELSATGSLTIDAISLSVQGGSNNMRARASSGSGNGSATATATALLHGGTVDITTTGGGVEVRGGSLCGDCGSYARAASGGNANINVNSELSASGGLTIHAAGDVTVAGGSGSSTQAYAYNSGNATAEMRALMKAATIDITTTGGGLVQVMGGSGDSGQVRAYTGGVARVAADAEMSATGLLTIRAGGDVTVQGGSGNVWGVWGNRAEAGGGGSASAAAGALLHGGTVDIATGGWLKVLGGDSARASVGGSGVAATTANAELSATGDVTVTTTDGLVVAGGNTARASVSSGGSAAATTNANAKLAAGGNMTLNVAGGMTVAGGTGASANASGWGSNNIAITHADATVSAGGLLTLNADNLAIQGGNYASASASGYGSSNAATATASATMQGGTVAITTPGALQIGGGMGPYTSGSPYYFPKGFAQATGTNSFALTNANGLLVSGGVLTVQAGSLSLQGGSAQATGSGGNALPFGNALANAGAGIAAAGDANITVTAGDMLLSGGTATANGTATADASAILAVGGTKTLNLPAGSLLINGGTVVGTGGKAAQAVFDPGTINANVGGDILLAGGNALGAEALLFSSGPINLTVGGATGISLSGGAGTGILPSYNTPTSPMTITFTGGGMVQPFVVTPGMADATIQSLYVLPPAVLTGDTSWQQALNTVLDGSSQTGDFLDLNGTLLADVTQSGEEENPLEKKPTYTCQ